MLRIRNLFVLGENLMDTEIVEILGDILMEVWSQYFLFFDNYLYIILLFTFPLLAYGLVTWIPRVLMKVVK